MTQPAPIVLWTVHDHAGHEWRAVLASDHSHVVVILQRDRLAHDLAQFVEEAAARAFARQWIVHVCRTYGGSPTDRS